MIINLPIERVSRVTNTSNSFTHKMAAKISWHRYRTKLRVAVLGWVREGVAPSR